MKHLKIVLTRFNCVDHCAFTSIGNSPSNKVLLALDWSHQELATMMHDLNHILVLVGVAFRGLKNHALIAFFGHASNHEIVAEVSFYKS